MPRIRFTAIVMAAFAAYLLQAAGHAAKAQELGPDGDLCAYETARQAKAHALPENLLTALSHVESGRWDGGRQEKVAWPWTVMAEGRGRFFRTKAEAIKEVRGLQARGVRNIDVGCMQINLMFHADAFPDLDTALDPAANVAYAVDFLKALRAETGSWMKAATRYHSATPEHARRYHGKLVAEWNNLNAEGAREADRLVNLAGRYAARKEAAARPAADQLAAITQRQRALAAAKAEQDRQREEARRFAENWRAQRLAQYMKSKIEKAGSADAS